MKNMLWLGLLVVMATPLSGQFPPERGENLQVLPDSMTGRQIIGVMRGFAMGLGVRCEYCHVGEAGQPLASFDFVSDEKGTKRKAREMLRMVHAINNMHLADLPDRSDPPIQVSCATCHHGVSVPRELTAILAAEYETGGIDGAMGRYEALREEYYGGYSYDFGEQTLVTFAQSLGRSAPGDAVRALDRNLELFPESVQTLVLLGQAHNLMGHQDVAIEILERAVQLAPEDRFVRQTLERIRGPLIHEEDHDDQAGDSYAGGRGGGTAARRPGDEPDRDHGVGGAV